MPNSGIAVSAKASDIPAAIKIVDWIYGGQGRYVSVYGIEGETFTIDSDGRPSLTPQMKRQANPGGKELIRDFGWVYYFNKYEFPVGFEKPVPGDPLPADDRQMYSRNVMESLNAVIVPDPTLFYTDDQAKILKNNGTEIRDHFNQNIDKFIMGTRPIGEWPKFIDEIRALGMEKAAAVLNEAYSAYKKR
jgi:putative aldouronate transport system substrate-binding protein